MRIGVPRETKEGESRVGLVPRDIAPLVREGHEVCVEAAAGEGAGVGNEDFRAAGASVAGADAAWDAALVVKVKEVQDADLPRLRAGCAIFGFQHLPHEPERTHSLARSGATAIAFEMVRDASGRFPLLAPMSEIAGRMAIEAGERLLGHAPRQVLVLGAGNAGLAAASQAAARGARVTLLTRSSRSRDAAGRVLGASALTGIASAAAIEQHALEADLVVGAVFVAGEPTPKLLARSLVARMRRGAVLVDISIDAGGVAETSHPTTHAEPTYVEEGVVHYCIANMPAAAPRESAAALSGAALPYVREMAAKGIARALRENRMLRAAVLLWKGRVTHPGIAAEAALPYTVLTDADLA